MKLSKAVDLFLVGLLADGRSKYTSEWYRQCLTRLVAYLHDPELAAIGADHLRQFFADLHTIGEKYTNHKYRKPQKGGLSPFTIQGYVRAIKRFFSWLVENDYLTPSQNIAAKIKRQSLPRSVPKDIAEDDFRALLGAVAQSPYPQRDLAILLFLADTGCRVGGLVALRLADLDLERGRVLVTEKGRKSRFVFLSKNTLSALSGWLQVRQSALEFVFVGRRGDRLTIWGVREILERLAKRAGVKGHFNPHSFRHRFGKRFLMDGGDLASLQRLLGHSDVSVTSNFYAVFLVDELQKKHDEHSPLTGIL